MMFAVVWHYWLGFFLAFGVVLAVLGVIGGYVMKVQRPKYPRKN